MEEWPILDFDVFPNQMISGMTLPEIKEYLNDIERTPPRTQTRFANPIGDNDFIRKRSDLFQTVQRTQIVGAPICMINGHNPEM